MLKKCGACGVEKGLDDFHKSASAKDGRTSRCKPCAVQAARLSYERKAREQNPDIDLVRAHRVRIAEARAAGHTHFMPLIPCPAGHLGPRFTASQCCKECGTERRRAGAATEARVEKKRSALRRKVAAQNGQKHYQGAACKRGHAGLRLVSTRQCVECLAARTEDRQAGLSPEARRRKLAKRRRRAGRSKQRAYQSTVLMKRPEYRLQRYMYACIRRIVQGAGLKKKSRTAEALGYTHHDLRAHIERQFKPGMTWDNYGAWHIDHKTAISEFVARGVTDPAVVNALSNLQPLWAVENLSKGGLRGQERDALAV